MQAFSYKFVQKRLFTLEDYNLPSINLTCWIITEGLKGTENQCLGVAEAMNMTPTVKQITLKQPWAFLSPYLGFEHAGIFSPPLESPWPDILITSGRKAIAAARYIKKASGGKTFAVHIQDPRARLRDFDLVAVALHDPSKGPNVINTLAAPNRITEAQLIKAREDFPAFGNIKKPRVAVLIGGNSKAHTLSETGMKELCQKLKTLNAGLMITASRRTGAANQKILQDALKDSDAFIWDGSGANPYFAMLGWADYILVTEDSVSMASDAATTGKPIHVIELEGGAARLDAFHKNMQDAGITRPFTGALESWSYTPLRDAQKIADEIKNRLKD